MKKMFVMIVIFMLITGVLYLKGQELPDVSPPEPAVETTAPGEESVEKTSETAETEEKQEKKSQAQVSPFNFYMGIGSEIIGDVTYTSIALQPDLSFGKFGIGLDVIIRFDSNFKLYEPDWDETEDIIAKINYIRWATKGAPLFIKIGLLDDVYLGHGSIFYRYSNKLFLPEKRRIGAQFDLDMGPVGWELFDDDVIDNRIFGGRLFIRPFRKSGVFFLKKLAFGLTTAADVKIPDPYPGTEGPADKVTVMGGDIDIPIFQVRNLFEFILFTDYVKNLYFKGTDGTGIMPGFILNLLGFRFVGEYHIYNPHFDGPYFNAFYDIERNMKLLALEQKTEKSKGWSVKMAKEIFGWVFIGFEVGGELGKAEYEKPDMHIELGLLQRLLNKLQGSVYYDKTNIEDLSDAFTAQSENARLSMDIVYAVSKNVDLIVFYQRTYTKTEDPMNPYEPVENISMYTKIKF